MHDVKVALEEMSIGSDNQKPSLAVLPFENMSGDKENEYFSDGLAEEIINLLAQIPGLRVIARTSAFAFKGKHEDVRQIARALGVTNVLEGSVRKAGNRIRVTAQLITAADGSQPVAVPYWTTSLNTTVVAYGTPGFPTKHQSAQFGGRHQFLTLGRERGESSRDRIGA